MKNYLTLLFLSLGLLFIACGDSEEPEEEICTTTDLTYTADISPIIQTNCSSASGCHGSTNGNTFIMTNYQQTFLAFGFSNMFRAINHEGGATAMPLGGTKLDQCLIDKLQAWVNDGAPE